MIPALLKPLDRGFTEGAIALWMVPVALIGLFGWRGVAVSIAQYAYAPPAT
jgi:subfamily B ATP-binding cassette protein MsbA